LINKDKKTFSIRTFGCQMNVSDSQRVAGMLEASGWQSVGDAGPADLVFFNTCAVREKAESKLYSELGRIAHDAAASQRDQRRPLVAVGGCVAQLRGRDLLSRRDLPIDVLVGPRSLDQLPDLLVDALSAKGRPQVALDRPGQDAFRTPVPSPVAGSVDRARALVTVMEGCNQVCSFCVVPRTRGTEVFRPPEAVVAEVRHWVEQGSLEVVLLGQTVNAYRWNGLDFAGLLAKVSAVDGLRRLRFATSHPRHMTEALTEAYASLPNLCPHLHLPVQSGSDKVLASMRRGYSSGEYIECIEALRRRVPGLSVWSDLIVGYPGESQDDFQRTLDLVTSVAFDGLYTFTYSPRPGTVAFRSPDDVPVGVKRERLAHLNQLQQGIQLERNRGHVGAQESVLMGSIGRDGQLEGRTPHNRVVHCAGDASLVGQICEVEITSAGPNSLVGRVLDGSTPERRG
jgi:tRNA-2-methylthio-N6-dimethylallyladenosine synthase